MLRKKLDVQLGLPPESPEEPEPKIHYRASSKKQQAGELRNNKNTRGASDANIKI